MMILLALLVVPLAALGLVLGMDRVEERLLKQPARHRSDAPARQRRSDAGLSAAPALTPAPVLAPAREDLAATRVAA